jgi:putative (di)nucleoside polyphosphate hydrolase
VAQKDFPGYRQGVGIVLLNQANKVFVGQRLDKTSEAWQMPQGGIDPGETPKAAVMRELMEEVGTDKAEIIFELPDWLFYDLPAEIAAKLWKGRYKGQRQKWFVLRFLGDDKDIDINTAEPEFSEWKWADLKELPHLVVPFKRNLYAEVISKCSNLFTPQD